MNRLHRVIWNATRGLWVVVSELAKRKVKGRRSSRNTASIHKPPRLTLLAVSLSGLLAANTANADDWFLPVGNGSWSDEDNWQSGDLPVLNTDATVSSGGTAIITAENALVRNLDIAINSEVIVDGTITTLLGQQTIFRVLGTLELQDGNFRVRHGSIANLANMQGAIGSNTITVQHSGSQLNILQYETNIGSSGGTTLLISNGGVVNSARNTIGTNRNQNGAVIVDGTGAHWDTERIVIGDKGTGSLTVRNGGKATMDLNSNLFMGRPESSFDYEPDPDAANSVNTLNIGAASGESAVAPGTLTAKGIKFGQGTNTVVFNHTSDDYEFSLDISTQHERLPPGSIEVFSGTTLFTGDIYSGVYSAFGDEFNTTGERSLFVGDILIHGGALSIGNGGTDGWINGDIRIEDNGSLIFNHANDKSYAYRVNGTGTLIKQGENTLTLNRVNHTGHLLVEQGALVLGSGSELNNSGNATIGNILGKNADVSFSAANRTWTLAGNLFVGTYGDGRLDLDNVGTINSAGGYIGNEITGAGNVTVSGVGSSWNILNALYVGSRGNGILNIRNGSVVQADVIYLGDTSTGTGTINFGAAAGETPIAAGTLNADIIHLGNTSSRLVFNHTQNNYFLNSQITGSGGVDIYSGSARFTRSNSYTGGTTIHGGALGLDGAGRIVGDVVNNGELLFWVDNPLTYSGVISGTGRVQTESDLTLIGNNTYSGGTYNGRGAKLSIGNGGTTGSITGNINGIKITTGFDIGDLIFNRSDDITFDGAISDQDIIKRGAGSLTLTGNSIENGNLRVENGELIINSGGLVSNTNSFIAGSDGASGVLVDGSGSRWNTTAINVGDTHAGTLTISNDGSVTATAVNGGVLLGSSTASGTLNIGAAAGDSAVAAGTLSADRVTFGSAASNIVFNHTSTDYTFATDITGNGAVELYSGLTNLTGNSSYSGSTLVNGGMLKVNNLSGSATGSGSVTIANGASLGGSGTIAGSVTLADGGRLAAGNSPGNLTLGELLLNNASVLDYELASPSGIAGVDSDLITVTGDLTLDGILNITDLGGFDFAVSSGDTGSYRLFDYGGTLIDNVISFGSGLLAGYNYSIDTATAGAVTLVADFTGLQFWDGNNNIANATVDGGNGTWSAGDTNWTNQSGNTNSNWGELTAVFGGTAGTVEVDGSHTVQGLQFVTDNYLLQDTDNNGALVLADSGADVRANSGVNAVIDVALGGNGSLSKTGAGTITLQGNNTYTGDTIISDGTLQLGDNNRIANTSDLVINGGTFDLNNFNETVANLSGSGGTINIGAGGSGTLTVNQTVDQTYAGNFSGASGRFQDAIIKNGAATLALTGTNSQTGVGIVRINAGRLAVDGGNAIGDSQMLTGVGEFELLSDETIGFLNMSGGQVLLNDNTLTLGSISGISGGNDAVISGTGNIIIDGDSIQVFHAANTYTGSTTINSGELRTLNLSALGNNSAVAVNSGGALLLFDDLNIGSLAGDGAVTLTSVLGSHSLTSGADNTSTTFSGVLSGAGGRLNKTGTGTLTLTGSNTYTGGTTISDGLLQGTTTSLQGDIVNNATLVFDQAANGTFSAVVSGSGALTKSGSGTLTLSGANSYSGGTTISAGVLQGTTASLQGDIINNATLAFDQDANATFSGAVSGSGVLSKSGSGTLTLSGANSYSGGTTVSGGILQGSSTSLQGDISNNAMINFDQAADGVYAGVMKGPGSLIKSGAGMLTLSGMSSYSGTTIIDGGRLAVNGSIANSATTINAGGTLGGSGIVGSISLNGGALAPGNSIGTLNVAGNLDFSGGGVYEVEVDAGGNADLINATGSAILTNGSVLVLPEAGDYKVSTDYTILTAAGGLGGTTFGSISSNLAFLTPTLSYDANNVLLNLRRNSSDYASVAETANQGSVGTALDTVFGSDSAGTDELFNNLNILSAAGASQAYDSLSGVQHTYSNQIALQSLNQFKVLLFDRLQGNSQFLASNGQLMLTYNDNGTVTDVGSQLLGSRPVADRGWWLRGTGSYGEIDGTRNASGAHYNASGTATGIDFNLDDALTLGAAFGYSTTGAGVDQGDLEVDSYQAAFYGRWLLDDGYYASGIAGFGYHDIDAKRGINVGISSSTAKADYDAWTGNVAVEAGRTLVLNQRTRVTPLAGLEYAHINRESFTEHGAGAADLHVSRDQQDSLRSALGARLEHSWTTSNGSRIQPTIELAWLHEFMDNEAGLRAGFAPAPGASFAVSGPELNRDRARIGLGLDVQVNETASLRLGYQGEFASSDQRHDISATFKMAW
jgi:outer membrane autotransporter protein